MVTAHAGLGRGHGLSQRWVSDHEGGETYGVTVGRPITGRTSARPTRTPPPRRTAAGLRHHPRPFLFRHSSWHCDDRENLPYDDERTSAHRGCARDNPDRPGELSVFGGRVNIRLSAYLCTRSLAHTAPSSPLRHENLALLGMFPNGAPHLAAREDRHRLWRGDRGRHYACGMLCDADGSVHVMHGALSELSPVYP